MKKNVNRGNKSLASFYKKTGGKSKFVNTVLTIYDNGKNIYETDGSLTLPILKRFIEMLNMKYGTNYEVIDKNR